MTKFCFQRNYYRSIHGAGQSLEGALHTKRKPCGQTEVSTSVVLGKNEGDHMWQMGREGTSGDIQDTEPHESCILWSVKCPSLWNSVWHPVSLQLSSWWSSPTPTPDPRNKCYGTKR